MLFVIDVGNTSVHLGLFDGDKFKRDSRIPTDRLLSKGISGDPGIRDYVSGNPDIRDIIICSVVPKADRVLRKLFPKAIFVNYQNIGIKIMVKKPSEVGADRLVNALAAYILYGGPAIIIDFGTATTFDVINEKGEYLGGAIAPGLLLARDALHLRTAKLPRINLKAPKNAIGKSSVEAMQSGLVLGYVAMVEGMIKKIKSEIRISKSETNQKSKIKRIKVIATGGLAPLICNRTDVIDTIDQTLTLKGLNILCQKS